MRPRALLFAIAVAACGACGGAPSSVQAPVTLEIGRSVAPAVVELAPEKESKFVSEEGAAVPIFKDDPYRGSRFALVTIVGYSDLECPYCARAHLTIDELFEKYGPDDLRFVWKHNPLPFHPRAELAAETAVAVYELAGRDAFFAFCGRVFGAMNAQARVPLTPELLARWGAEAGADASRLATGMSLELWKPRVARDLEQGKALGVTGTPTFFINGAQLVGAQPREKFESTIDAHLAEARAAVARGTPRSRVYTEMARENRGKKDADD